MKRALLDTSFILYYVELNLNPVEAALLAEGVVAVYIPLYVLDELSSLSSGGGRKGRIARIALEEVEVLSRRGKVYIVDPAREGDVDTSLIRLARRCGFVLFTADRGLKRRAVRSGVEVYSPVAAKAGRRVA